jgi:hypothetical protein
MRLWFGQLQGEWLFEIVKPEREFCAALQKIAIHCSSSTPRRCGYSRRPRLSTSARPGRGFDGRRTIVRSKKSELNVCEAVGDIFDCASLEAEPFGHHPQTVPQFCIAVFDVVSNLAALEYCEQGIGNSPPSYRLPFLQLTYFAA